MNALYAGALIIIVLLIAYFYFFYNKAETFIFQQTAPRNFQTINSGVPFTESYNSQLFETRIY